MANLFDIQADPSAVLALLARVPKAVEGRLKHVALETANRVALEAKRRVPVLTGVTQEGIVVREAEDGSGYVVEATRHEYPNLPQWLDEGTKRMPASPFFDISVQQEQGPHLRRVREALEDELEGLGA